MIFYSTIFILSVGGIIAIIYRNREDFAAFSFANFMEELVAEAKKMWHSHLREKSFSFLEKRLHGVRILTLKAETKLFKAAKTLRGIKEKNGNGNSDVSSKTDTM